MSELLLYAIPQLPGQLRELEYAVDLYSEESYPGKGFLEVQLRSCDVTGEAWRDPVTLDWQFSAGWVSDPSHVWRLRDAEAGRPRGSAFAAEPRGHVDGARS
jgi:hypothetical protein